MSKCGKCLGNSCVCNCKNDLTRLHEDLFGSPFNCKKQIPTRHFSSANSPLPPKELNRLQREIEEANALLRSIGSEGNPDNRRQLQLHFQSIRGADVIIMIICKEQEQEENEQEVETFNQSLKKHKNCKMENSIIEKRGKIYTAGRDFIQINEVGNSVFVLYDRLISVARDECEYDRQKEQELIDVDRKVRRELAFNFGEFVSKKPELVNLFFGIPLFKQLKEFLGEEVEVKIFAEKMVGTLIKVDEGSIQLFKEDDIEIEYNLNDICYIKILNLK